MPPSKSPRKTSRRSAIATGSRPVAAASGAAVSAVRRRVEQKIAEIGSCRSPSATNSAWAFPASASAGFEWPPTKGLGIPSIGGAEAPWRTITISVAPGGSSYGVCPKLSRSAISARCPDSGGGVKSRGGVPAVDRHRDPGDERGLVGEQPDRRGGDLRRLGEAADRVVGAGRRDQLLVVAEGVLEEVFFDHRGHHVAGAECVDADALLGVL